MLPWVLEGVPLGNDLLEVGPGPGATTELLRNRVARMTAIEVDSRLSDALKKRMEGTNVTVVEGDATEIGFDDGQFSCVLSLTMLHHVPSVELQDRLLAEAHRVLQPHGLFVGVDNTLNIPFRMLHIGDTLVPIDPESFGARLEAAGFNGIVVDRIRGRFKFQAVRPE